MEMGTEGAMFVKSVWLIDKSAMMQEQTVGCYI